MWDKKSLHVIINTGPSLYGYLPFQLLNLDLERLLLPNPAESLRSVTVSPQEHTPKIVDFSASRKKTSFHQIRASNQS